MGIAQLMLGLSFSFNERLIPLALSGQALFMAAFSIGAGPCSMMVASELFPLQVRGFALGVATLINRVTSGTVALTFLSMSRVLTPSGAYFMFAGLAACAFTFIGRYVPETRGKSLEEIERTLTERFSAGPGVPREVAIVDSLELAPSSNGASQVKVESDVV